MKKFLLAGLFLLPGLAIGSEPINLSFNLDKGAKYEYRIEMEQDLKQDAMGMNVPIKTEISTTFLMEVKDKTAQETQIQFVYRELMQAISSVLINMRYDSRKPAENQSEIGKVYGKMFDKLMDKPIMMTVAPDGSVKSVTGMEVIVEEMVQAVAADGPQAARMGAEVRKQFGDAALKSMFERSLKIYPANAVRTGDSWHSEITLSLANMNAVIKTKYTLKEVKKNMATVAAESDMMIDMAEMGVEAKLAGTQTGTMVIDTRTGMPVKSDALGNVKGSYEVQGINVQVELVNKIKASVKEVR